MRASRSDHAERTPGLAAVGDRHCLGVGRLQVDRDWSHAMHHHDFEQMMVILGGALEVTCAGERCTAAAGSYLHYPAGADHAEAVNGPDGADFVYFAFDRPVPTAPLLVPDQNGRGVRLATWLAEDGGLAADAGHLDHLLHCLLAEWLRAAANPLPAFVHRVRTWMMTNLSSTVGVADLARVAAMSEAHFSRRFKAATGRTPMADMQALRVETARNLVQTTDLTLTAIAERVGACDGHHLSRLFRQHYGRPPSFFRAPSPSTASPTRPLAR